MAPVDIDRIRAEYTAPHYLAMADLDDAAARRFAALADAAEVDEVRWMLETEEWRCRKAGAWFALRRREPEIAEALRLSLLSSRGSLTAPDLGIVLVQRLGADALPLLLEYQATALREQHGAQGPVSALIRSLGGVPLADDASELELARTAAMQETAALIARV